MIIVTNQMELLTEVKRKEKVYPKLGFLLFISCTQAHGPFLWLVAKEDRKDFMAPYI